ncbi:MAG: pas4 [Nonomuraea muscovyensis]|nr:pas4 [Nonomuraea muscovyensis]
MAIFRRRSKDGPLLPEDVDLTVTPRTITAAAMPMSGPGVKIADRARKFAANSDWQKQGWYYYDVIGELRAPLVWIANAVSQADLHATEIDPATGTPTGPSTNPVAMQAAAQVLGGAAKRATLLRVLALCWQVPGEAWVVVRPQGRTLPDEWIVLPPSQVKSKGTGAAAQWMYRDPKVGVDIPLDAKSRLFRIWDPHPADYIQADSAIRPALPICREIEKSTQTIAGQLDSRLALAGLLLLADELDLPKGEGETTASALMDELLSAAEATIQQPGTPSAVVPIAINAPADMIASGGALAFVNPVTEFVGGLDELREKALARLAATLDMPRDVAAGTQGESNHWSAWQVEESTYKIYIEPLLRELGDALTEQWYRPALVAMGMSPEQANRFEIGWDTTKIVARPDDTENLRDLHDRILISNKYMLNENGVPEDAAPDEAEYTQRFLERIVVGAPTLLADPNVARALGLDIVVAPAATGVSGEVEGGELEAAPPADASEPRALPGTEGAEPEPEGVPDGLTAAAEVIVKQALSRAGGKLLTRENRGQYLNVPKHELYQHIRPSEVTGLVELQFTSGVAETFGVRRAHLAGGLGLYVEHLLRTGEAFDREQMRWYLR